MSLCKSSVYTRLCTFLSGNNCLEDASLVLDERRPNKRTDYVRTFIR